VPVARWIVVGVCIVSKIGLDLWNYSEDKTRVQPLETSQARKNRNYTRRLYPANKNSPPGELLFAFDRVVREGFAGERQSMGTISDEYNGGGLPWQPIT